MKGKQPYAFDSGPRPCGPSKDTIPGDGAKPITDSSTDPKQLYGEFRKHLIYIQFLVKSAGVPATEKMVNDVYDRFLAWVESEDDEKVMRLIQGHVSD